MSLKKFIIALALFAAVNAYPAEKSSITTKLAQEDKRSYSTLPLFSVFKPIIELFPSLADIGPKIEIGDKYTNIIIKAEQYKVEELIVQIKGRYVSIEGSKKTVQDDRDLSSEFLYTASLPHNANTSDVFAKFYSDNYLVVTTPNKGLDIDVTYVDRIVPVIVSEYKYFKKNENDVTIQVTTEHIEEVTEKITMRSSTPVSMSESIVTTTTPEQITGVQRVTTPEHVTEVQRVTTPETKEITVEPVTIENLLTSSDVTTPTVTLEEVAETEREDIIEKVTESEIGRTTPYIEAVTENTTPYIRNEISNLESTTSSL